MTARSGYDTLAGGTEKSKLTLPPPQRSLEMAATARLILADPRNSEHRRHCIADELIHGPAMPLDRGAQLREIPTHDRLQRLRIQLLAKCREASHIAEQRRHHLACPTRRGTMR